MRPDLCILDTRVDISTSLNRIDFRVKKLISRGMKSEIYSIKMNLNPLMMVLKVATDESAAEKEILNEIQLLTKLQHRNIIGIRGALVAKGDPFIGNHTDIHTYTIEYTM